MTDLLLRKAAKASTAAVIAGLGAAVTALTDDAVSSAEWVSIALAAAVAFGGVYGVSNTAPQPGD